jgi:5-methylcytosine-specific restriction endonuclease McrA
MSTSPLHQLRVLVLNRYWHPLAATTPAEILGAMMNDQAVGLDIRSSDWIQPVTWPDWKDLPVRDNDLSVGTTTGSIRIPTVVVLSRFDQVPRKRLNFGLRGLYERDGGRCQYTGRSLTLSEANIDHVLPSSRGGTTSWENCVLSDRKVNNRKADRTPREAGLTLLREPFRPPELPINHFIKNRYQIKDWNHFLPKS